LEKHDFALELARVGEVGNEHRIFPRGMYLMLLSPSFSENNVSSALSKDGSGEFGKLRRVSGDTEEGER